MAWKAARRGWTYGRCRWRCEVASMVRSSFAVQAKRACYCLSRRCIDSARAWPDNRLERATRKRRFVHLAARRPTQGSCDDKRDITAKLADDVRATDDTATGDEN